MGQTCYFGNGSTAIYASLKALGCSGKSVALPSIICPSVIAAILASGNTPYFVDIETNHYGISPEALAGVIGEVGAVIAVHAFGIPCNIAAIGALCAGHAVPLIEDCALAQGAADESGVTVGDYGDVAIFSYGAGKIIDLGEGGAAVTSKVELAARIDREHALLPLGGEDIAAGGLGGILKYGYNNFYPDALAAFRGAYTTYLSENRSSILRAFEPQMLAALEAALMGLGANVAARREKYAHYESRLRGLYDVVAMRIPAGAAPWRFNLLVEPGLRDGMLRAMLREGRRVSSWYTDMSAFLSPSFYRATPLPASRWLSDRVLNFWVDESTTSSNIAESCERIRALSRAAR